MEGLDIYKLLELLVPVLIALLSLFFGVARVNSIKEKLTQAADLVADVDKALADNKVDEVEMKHLVADVLKILGREVPK